MTMSKTQRVKDTLAMRAVDRPPVSIWRHFYVAEQSAEGLAEAMLQFERTYDWDFMKVNPRAMYHDQDWGNRYEFFSDEHTKPELLEHAVARPADFRALGRLDVTAGVLGEQLRALELIRDGLDPDVPFIMTVFTPLSVAAQLAGGPEQFRTILSDPENLMAGLETITATFEDFTRAALERGAAGLFFATTKYGTFDTLTVEEFNRFSRPFDLRILRAASGGWFNLLHVCGGHSLIHEVLDYPVGAFHWDNTHPANPSLADLRRAAPEKVLVGGISTDVLPDESKRDTLLEQVREGHGGTGGLGWIVGSTCTVPTDSADAQLKALREAVEQL
jgi:uroporphyrinogen decarboxylase